MISFDFVALHREYLLAAKRRERELELSLEDRINNDLNIWEHEDDGIRERMDYKVSRNNEYDANC